RKLMDQKTDGVEPLLLIAGDGAEEERIQQYAAAQLGRRAILVGRLSRQDMRHYYSAADIFAFPGYEESLGMVYLEAQACRLPVVACEDWGAREAVLHGETGLLSPARDEQVFVDHLEQLLSDDEFRQKMGRAAEQHVGLVHDIEYNYSRMLECLEKIAVKA
ncbi:MAG: glycosyltransferase, partial [Desulfopila sp.]